MSESVVMYAKGACGFCRAARHLLRSKGVSWAEVSLDAEPDRRAEMIERTGERTVPQIFIGHTHVGGFDDLDALDQEGALDRMLEAVSRKP